ncbi:ATP-binding cassette domain-containing protein [Sporanaerobium hydrogeniformans]|uniref:ATP-binding cassette domain-containing protein n=1 Tax=Sporanaerobium hydrogeniformans TaxID=3072179 RepID=UPI00117A7195|nr:ATP-binding cassette domain-containing protein [Sporanaerobium hydrogeniformans]
MHKFPEKLGILIENPGFIPHYSGIKNLKILNGMSKMKVPIEQVRAAMIQVGLDPNSKKHVKNYSLGMRQKLGIAQAIMNEPELLILDEPMNGLDEQSIKEMRAFFLRLREEKQVTLLVASHNKEDLEVLCDELFEVHDKGVRRKGEVTA